jgi:hypothetical protein
MLLRLAACERKFGAFGVDPLVDHHVEAEVDGGVLDVAGKAGPVDLLVVQDRDLAAAVLVHHRGQRGPLDGVLRHDSQVVALARRVVLLGLALVRARLVRGQADRGVRGAHLRDRDLVQNWDRDRAGARVELADVRDRAVVLSDLLGVGLGGLGRPVARLRRRVVERRVLDGVVARLAAGLAQGELDAVHHRQRLEPLGALQRKRGIDAEALAAGPGAVVPAVVVLAASREARGDGQEAREYGRCDSAVHAGETGAARTREQFGFLLAPIAIEP